MQALRRRYREVWTVDTEFRVVDGEIPEVHCVVLRELFTGREIRQWTARPHGDLRPDVSIDEDCLFVAFYATAEMASYLALTWPLPPRVVDLYAEFALWANGRDVIAVESVQGGRKKKSKYSLLAAMVNLNVHGAMDAREKAAMRDLAIRGGPFSDDEQSALLDYCAGDVDCTERLFLRMLPWMELPHAELRGRYTKAVAAWELNGVPIDTKQYVRFVANWDEIKAELIREKDPQYGCFVPYDSVLKSKTKWAQAVRVYAGEIGVDPHLFATAVQTVWEQRIEGQDEYIQAIDYARLRTGLTVYQVHKWENSGRDYSTWPDLDVKARELAADFPELGIGSGYSNEHYDETDYAARLWDVCRTPTPRQLRRDDPSVLDEAVALMDGADDADVYRASKFSFSLEQFERYIARTGIDWPRTRTGQLRHDQKTMKAMSDTNPELQSLRDLFLLVEQLDSLGFLIGADGRNRFRTFPFDAKTGRNTPGAKGFVFGPARWLRRLIKPQRGRTLAYLDWGRQEFGIAAALSGDEVMWDAYQTADPYFAFAQQAGAIPSDANSEDDAKKYKAERNQFKQCVLAVQYGQGAYGLSRRIKQPTCRARQLLRAHRDTYAKFWTWVDNAVEFARLFGWLHSVFGWRITVGDERNPRSLLNYLMQTNGAELMRLAACFMTEAGVRVCCPVHDAFLIEAPDGGIEQAIATAREAMREASSLVLDGYVLKVDEQVVTWPDRYIDEKDDTDTWDRVQAILERVEARETAKQGEELPF